MPESIIIILKEGISLEGLVLYVWCGRGVFMYPVSETFLRAMQENTRRYYWTGRDRLEVVWKFGDVYEKILGEIR